MTILTESNPVRAVANDRSPMAYHLRTYCQSDCYMLQYCIAKFNYKRHSMARATPGLLIRQGADGTQERFPLRQELTTIGRSDSCVVSIPSPTVSRLHARVELQHDRYVIFDAGSANGTFVNGQ